MADRGDYFDRQTNWEWHVRDGKAIVQVVHDKPVPHSHQLDFTNILIHDLESGTAKEANRITGKLHRDSDHFPPPSPEKLPGCQGRKLIDSKRRAEFDPIADIANAGIHTAGYGSAGISAGGAVWIPAFSRSLRR